jgi:hypothetical protein
VDRQEEVPLDTVTTPAKCRDADEERPVKRTNRSTVILLGGVISIATVGVVACYSQPAVTTSGDSVLAGVGDEGGFCDGNRRLFPEIRWNRLRPGVSLRSGAAILTCRDARVDLRSTGDWRATRLRWVTDGEGVRGTVFEDRLIVLQGPPQVELEVTAVEGLAYYSVDREVIQRHGIIDARAMSNEEDEAQTQHVLATLSRMSWERVTVGRVLQPWDMLWTSAGGRVEFKIAELGANPTVDGSTAVLDARGNLTTKRRVNSNSYLIIHPGEILKATVSGVIGDVRVSRDQEVVEAFFRRHKSTYQELRPLTREEYFKWEETLRKEHLE